MPASPAKRRRLLRGVRTVLASVLVLLLPIGWSLGRAVTAPGTDSLAARVAEWGRDHGLGALVTAGENLQYQLSPPKTGGTPNAQALAAAGLGQAGVPTPPKALVTAAPRLVGLQAPLVPLTSPALAGEGVFRPVVMVDGQPAVQVAYLRPDASHTSYLAGVAWMSGRLLRLVQHPGFEDPGHLGLFSQPDTVPASARTGLVATFNSGFKIKDARGGYYQNGHTVGALTAGAASLVVYRDGHTAIGSWGPEVSMAPDVVSVRQNLRLLVDHGQLAPNLDSNVQSNWGATIKGAYYVWRSGIGITASGDLVFVAGDALSVHSLASLLQRAGAVRAMQLDINVAWISYMWYSPGAGASSPLPHKLVAFHRPANRYFAPASRDFFAVYAR